MSIVNSVSDSPIEDDLYFRKQRLRHNLMNIRTSMSFFYLVLFIMLITSLIISLTPTTTRYPLSLYFSIYLLFASTNMLLFIYFKKLRIKSISDIRLLKKYENQLLGYIAFNSIFGITLTIFDLLLPFNLLSFAVFILLCTSVFKLTNKQSKLLIGGSNVLLIPLLFIVNDDHTVLYQIMYLLVISFIALRVAKVSHSLYVKSYMTNQRLVVALRESESLSKQLIQKNFHLSNINSDLQSIAYHDALTNLPNRHALYAYITKALVNKPNHKLPISILIIDIDYFKNYNDYYGHNMGDVAIQKVANMLIELSKQFKDLYVARWGGEEFIFISKSDQPDFVDFLCQQCIQYVSALQIEHNGSSASPHLTISIGAYTTVIHNQQQFDAALHEADTHLYIVKANGRNHYYYGVDPIYIS